MKSILGSKLNIFIMVFPAFILFTSFVFIPLISNIGISFFDSENLVNWKFIGIHNYVEIFNDSEFWSANGRSFFLAILAVICDSFLGFVFAVLLILVSERLQRLFRGALLMPMVLSIVVISQLWQMIYDVDSGLLNKFLEIIGLSSLKNIWLINQKTALVCVAIVGMWQYFGYSVLLIFSGIKTIPVQYYEAAQIDGANFFQNVIKIEIPLLAEVIKSCMILFVIGGFYTFPQIYVMTKGGPGTTTQTIIYYLYDKVFTLQRFGLGTSAAVFAILETIIIVIFIQRTIAKERVEF